MLELAIQEVTKKTFNRVCVDGDTSTNDMAVILPTAWPAMNRSSGRMKAITSLSTR